MAELDNKPQVPMAGAIAQQKQNVQSVAQQPLPNQPAQQQARPCPKDCSKCSMAHQIYCAAKMTFDSFKVMNVIIQRLDAQSQRIEELEKRISAIQSSESEFADPSPVEGNLFTGTEG